jgi:hypothetical protein|tara:strand:- start:2155 stop:2403 length:249 start_codon:yes stop_codon:yes gene_type:complete
MSNYKPKLGQVEKWIKMSDRKPKLGQRVIYLTEGWTDDEGEVVEPEMHIAQYYGRKFKSDIGGDYIAEYVTHWKRLPKLPNK